MTIQQLKSTYTREQLYSGACELKYQIFSPLFLNLFENKVVYRERFVAIIQLEEIKITPERFDATAIPLINIETGGPLSKRFPNKTWKFGSVWDGISFTNDHLACTYGGWTIWTDPETVKQAEQYAMQKEFSKALKLTVHTAF